MQISASCIHGRWIAENDQCDCDNYWHGIDCNLRKCVAGFLNSTTFECQCRAGYGGEFCHINVCLHGGEWYCETEQFNNRQLCPDEYLKSWTPIAIDEADWNCSCGQGVRTLLHNASHTSCSCPDGFYGDFCQWNVCQQGTSQNVWNSLCEDGNLNFTPATTAIDETTPGRGVFGFALSTELVMATLLMTTFLVTFLVLNRLCSKRFRSVRIRSNDQYLERTAIDEFLTRRSSRNRLLAKIDVRHDGVPVHNDDSSKRYYTNGYTNGKVQLQHAAPFNDVFWWRNNNTPNYNHYANGRHPASRRLTTVIEEENSDLDEGIA